MTAVPQLLAGVPGVLLGILAFLFLRRQRAESRREAGLLKEELASQASRHRSDMELLNEGLESLSLSRNSSEDVLREGRLSGSSRAQALRMLRSGIAPDSAAVTLRLPSREMRLLGKVSRALSTYR